MDSGGPPAKTSKKLRQILRVVYCMIRKSFISRRKIMLDLHLLLKRGKIARKAMANTLNFNNDHRNALALSYNFQREVEFSCSNTPSCPMFHVKSERIAITTTANPLTGKVQLHLLQRILILEMLDDDDDDEIFDAEYSVVESPLRENEVVDEKVDKKAGELIRRFYEELKIQQRIPMTPLSEFQRR